MEKLTILFDENDVQLLLFVGCRDAETAERIFMEFLDVYIYIHMYTCYFRCWISLDTAHFEMTEG